MFTRNLCGSRIYYIMLWRHTCVVDLVHSSITWIHLSKLHIHSWTSIYCSIITYYFTCVVDIFTNAEKTIHFKEKSRNDFEDYDFIELMFIQYSNEIFIVFIIIICECVCVCVWILIICHDVLYFIILKNLFIVKLKYFYWIWVIQCNENYKIEVKILYFINNNIDVNY